MASAFYLASLGQQLPISSSLFRHKSVLKTACFLKVLSFSLFFVLRGVQQSLSVVAARASKNSKVASFQALARGGKNLSLDST